MNSNQSLIEDRILEAIEKNELKTLDVILSNEDQKIPEILSNEGIIVTAISRNHINIVKYLLLFDTVIDQLQNGNVVEIAVIHNRLKILQLLLLHPQAVASLADGRALALAIRYKHFDILEFLLTLKVVQNALKDKVLAQQLLNIAIKDNNFRNIKMLLSNCDIVDALDSLELCMVVIQYAHSQILDLLLNYANIVQFLSNPKVFRIAIDRRDIEIIKRLTSFKQFSSQISIDDIERCIFHRDFDMFDILLRAIQSARDSNDSDKFNNREILRILRTITNIILEQNYLEINQNLVIFRYLTRFLADTRVRNAILIDNDCPTALKQSFLLQH